jgi:hypothetical protein
METIVGELIAATLAAGSGCPRSDWIDRTLVTVDVTGVWSGTFGGLRGPSVVDFSLSSSRDQDASRETRQQVPWLLAEPARLREAGWLN